MVLSKYGVHVFVFNLHAYVLKSSAMKCVALKMMVMTMTMILFIFGTVIRYHVLLMHRANIFHKFFVSVVLSTERKG